MALMLGDTGYAAEHQAPVAEKPACTLYRVCNGSPAATMIKLMDMMGGAGSLFGPDDIIIIKPNVQWWNQGAPNLCTLKTFIDIIMERRGGFNGEVIIGENCHRGPQPWTAGSWAWIFKRNADIPGINTMNGLAGLLKKKYGDKFSVSHWIDVDTGGRRVCGPAEGAGYVYCDGTGGVPLLKYDNGATGNALRQVIMTYPVFTTDRGTTVDLKNGIWAKGSYTGQPLKFINFAALNHHSVYCGVTSALKNYLGISDLSGGADPANNGKLDGQHYNFHSFPFNNWAKGPVPGMLGGEIGYFMNTVRKADINIASAEWIGLASRTNLPAAHTRAVLACSDPVALDYHSAKYILHPNSGIAIHDPDNAAGPFYRELKKCAELTGYQFDERRVKLVSHDCGTARTAESRGTNIIGRKEWGTDFQTILKYMYLRFV
jgi:hypothetical protein